MACKISLLNTCSESRNRLFCFHWVGGSGIAFKPYALKLQNYGIGVYGVSINRQNGLKDSTTLDLEKIAQQVYSSMVDLNCITDCDAIILFGHSMGGIVAYELCKIMERMKINVSKLIVSAVKAPYLLSNDNRNDRIVKHHLESESDLIRYIKAIGGLPNGLDERFLLRMIPTIRNDYRLFETYQSAEDIEQLKTSIHSFAADDDSAVPITTVQEWRRYSCSYHSHSFCGSHFYIFDHVDEVADNLAKQFDK